MSEKPMHLPMDFGEALARIARTPKGAADAVYKSPKRGKSKAGGSSPRTGSRKTA